MSLKVALSRVVAASQRVACVRTQTRLYSLSQPVLHFSQYEMGPPDPIVGLNEAFAKDTSLLKVNVGVGAYRGDNGSPWILPCVRQAEAKIMTQNHNHEYLGIDGDLQFVQHALSFVYGSDSQPLREKRVAGIQTLSGKIRPL
jgi:aspartate aminotransferase